MNRTNIQWTDFTANPIRYKNADGLDVWACSKVSAGCTNCYAETLALSSRMVSKGGRSSWDTRYCLACQFDGCRQPDVPR